MNNPKITIEDALTVARDEGVPVEILKLIEKELRKLAEQEKAGRVPAEKSKSQYVVLLDDAEGQFEGKSFLGWVVKMSADLPPQVALDRAKVAGRSFNESKKGRKLPVKSIREVFAGVARKFWKREEDEGKKVIPQTKEPVLIMPTKGGLT